MRIKIFALLLRLVAIALLAGGAYFGSYLGNYNYKEGYSFLCFFLGVDTLIEIFFKGII